MALISPDDPRFRICHVTFETLVEIQMEAEAFGWGTRWSSVEALRAQVSENEAVLLQSFSLQNRGTGVQTCRCLVLFSSAVGEQQGGLATIDIDLTRLEGMRRLDRDSDVRAALTMMFRLATGGIEMVAKN